MAKKEKTSTIENRVYLFRDLSAAYLQTHGGLLASADAADRKRALRAIADLAYAACVVADGEELSAREVSAAVAEGSAGS